MIRRFLSIPRRGRAASAFALFAVTACGGGGGGGGIIVQPTATVTSVSVSPGTGAILVGATTTFVASVVVTGTATSTVTWTSSNPAVASVNASGNTVTVTGAGAGSATITATSTFDATKSGSATVTVTAPQTIVVTPSSRAFAATAGGALPAAQTVAVTASSGTINGLLATVSTTSGGNWLSASFTPTSTPSTFTLSANTTALAAGSYTGTVTIGAPGITTSAVINVTYTVTGGGNLCNTTTFTTVTLAQSVDGALASADCRVGSVSGAFGDVYRIVLGATTNLQIDLSTDSTVAPTNTFFAFDALVNLLDANGALIASDDDGGIMTNSQLTRTLAAGTYFIQATSFVAGETGGYTLMVSTSGAAGGMCAAAGATTLTVGFTTAGALATTDCFGRRRTTVGAAAGRPFGDFYRLTRATTNTITLTMTATSFDTFLRLFDSDLIILAEDDDGGGGTNSRISRSLPAGTYFLMATAFDAGSTGAYSIAAAATAANLNLVPATDADLSPKVRAALLRSAAHAAAGTPGPLKRR